jgi:hypothetical protein
MVIPGTERKVICVLLLAVVIAILATVAGDNNDVESRNRKVMSE